MILDPNDLPAASSLLSSRWSSDSLVTMRPGRLYDGRVLERVEPETLEYLVQDLERSLGPLQLGAARMGVLTWDVACEGARAPFVLQVPRVLDESGSHGRAVREVPAKNLENMRHFRERGLARFVAEPLEARLLAGGVPAALFEVLPKHRVVTFGRGAIQLELVEGAQTWFLPLGPAGTAEVLAELVAALVYHYEPDAAGGTAIADVCVNDGDFAVRRRADGSFDVRLTSLRRLESGIGPSLLLLYLSQLLAYEDWTIDGNLIGLPTLMSNPSVAFAGLIRGLRYRARDLGQSEARAEAQALDWIRDFGSAREGRAYRPWVERFLSGRLPLSFGADLREHWWRVIPLETRFGLLELQSRAEPRSSEGSSARAIRTFLDRLALEIGRGSEDAPDAVLLNDLGREGLETLLAEAQFDAGARSAVVERVFAEWPHRSLDHLLGRVPEARPLRRMKSRLVFGPMLSGADAGTLRSLAPLGRREMARRPVANREIFSPLPLPTALVAEALRTFPTFEAYMDAALHQPLWGYYTRRVIIGRGGHFLTHPEEFSPDYGRWIANWAFTAWRDLLGAGDLSEGEPFPIIEFGAGNGRLARDVLDAIAARASESDTGEARSFASFATRASYRIYETSESLRARQQDLLGSAASISAGDARRPAETLKRDFPGGVKGFVVTNEVPDAFGVHKVVLGVEGEAFAALVVPRVERALLAAVSPELAGRIRDIDASIRSTFGFHAHGDECYLDERALFSLLETLSALPDDELEARLGALWFEEAYVPAAAIPELAEQLSANASDYAVALAAENSGVVQYVNVHATRFVRELAASMAAGFIVTIDYGDSTFGLVQGARRGDFPFRVYRDASDFRPRPNDPYAAPGTQDMTADVNFSELARAGRDAGLTVVHFGHERDVAGDELAEVLRSAAEHPGFAKLVGTPVFKVLVLGTRSSAGFGGPLASPLPLSRREQDIPKARRSTIATIERALASLAPSR